MITVVVLLALSKYMYTLLHNGLYTQTIEMEFNTIHIKECLKRILNFTTNERHN